MECLAVSSCGGSAPPESAVKQPTVVPTAHHDEQTLLLAAIRQDMEQSLKAVINLINFVQQTRETK